VVAQEASRLVTAPSRPFSAAGDVLAYVSRSDILSRPTWVDRVGLVLGPAASITGQLRDIRLSPDGRLLSVSRLTDESRTELLLVDLQRDTVTPLAQGLSIQGATWSADGKRLIGANQQGKERGIYWMAPEEGSRPLLLVRPGSGVPTAPKISPDSKYVCFSRYDDSGNFDIFVRETAGEGEGRALLSGPALEASCTISPDGRWFAYHSNETGTFNIFVRSFPDGQQKHQISVDGGQRPAWRADGRELYYLAPNGGLIAVTVRPGAPLQVGTHTRLFTVPFDPSFGTPGVMLFDPARDGQRFVMLVPTSDVPQPVTVILNWRSLLPTP
jgi:Tol biopolymer transport system component